MNAEKPVFTTPWFNVLEKRVAPGEAPHYIINAPDYAIIVAGDSRGRLLLVRQYRLAMKGMTLELPAGHIEVDETPEQTARKELLEETGYEAGQMELLGKLAPSTARFTNRMWVFFADDVRRAPDAEAKMEEGMHLVVYDRGWKTLLQEPEFYAGPSCAALFMALAKGRI